jgi:hypothetical protein
MYGQWMNKDDILPRKTDTKQNLTKFMLRHRLSKVWGLDNMLLAPGKVELNNTTKCQPRRLTFGFVESVNHLHQDHADEEENQVLSLYHVPMRKGRVQSQVRLPMVDDLYDFRYKVRGEIRYFLPAVARANPQNTCSMLHYHSLLKGTMPKHQDLNLILKEANGHQKILSGSPIMILSLLSPMCFDIWGLDKDYMDSYKYAAEKNLHQQY